MERCVISDPARLECLSKVLGASPQPQRHEQNQPPGYLGNKVFYIYLFIYLFRHTARARTRTQRGIFSAEEMFCGGQRESPSRDRQRRGNQQSTQRKDERTSENHLSSALIINSLLFEYFCPERIHVLWLSSFHCCHWKRCFYKRGRYIYEKKKH